MQRLEVSCGVRRIYTSLGAKGFILYREIFAVYSESHKNTQFGQNVEFVCVKTWWYTTNKQYSVVSFSHHMSVWAAFIHFTIASSDEPVHAKRKLPVRWTVMNVLIYETTSSVT